VLALFEDSETGAFRYERWLYEVFGVPHFGIWWVVEELGELYSIPSHILDSF
jgi:hypothetical protein